MTSQLCHQANVTLDPLAEFMQGVLRVAIGRLFAFQDQLQRRLERRGLLRIRRHWEVVWLTRILLIHQLGHLVEGLPDLPRAGENWGKNHGKAGGSGGSESHNPQRAESHNPQRAL